MGTKSLVAILVIAVALLIGVQWIAGVRAQPQMPMYSGQMGMMGSQGMSMGPMMHQMQAHMAQMTASVKALRGQLNKINPDLLTGQERPMYEYLKILQTHLESMAAMMGTMQGTMMQMP